MLSADYCYQIQQIVVVNLLNMATVVIKYGAIELYHKVFMALALPSACKFCSLLPVHSVECSQSTSNSYYFFVTVRQNSTGNF